MHSQPNLTPIEQKVQAAYQTIHPRASFAARLRAKVDTQARTRKAPHSFMLPFRLAVVGIALVLMMTTVLAIGPQTILAHAKTLFGFIPGVGFVDEDSAVHLCRPVEVTQNGVTLKIDQAGGSADELHIQGSVIHNPDPNYTYTFFLVDPQGNKAQQLNGGGTSEKGPDGFENVFRLTSASRIWTLDSARGLSAELELCPGSQSSAAEAASKSLYVPGAAVTAAKGLIFQVQQVAQLKDLTAIKMETSPDSTAAGPRALGLAYLDSANVELRDDAGNVYALRQLNMAGTSGDPVTSFEFDPIRGEARSAILRIQRVTLDDDTSVPFALDLGENPQPGQTWDLEGTPGSEYQIGGYTIALLNARYTEERKAAGDDPGLYTLEITASVTPPIAEYTPESIKLEIANHEYSSSDSPIYGTAIGSKSPDGTLMTKAFFAYPLTEQPVTGLIGWLGGTLTGPWEIQWELPK